ncbi:site-specific DNA-methyltransferase [Candidatus Bathyarchaeota archaeon]|nr:site-specific DNA-methyltransferase [Candidatus Bathyarchaeota archaeon]
MKRTNKKRGGKGPPNRMNDLSYKNWMKFQKSFFIFESVENLVEECIFFFTKSRWPNGNPSRILVLDKKEVTYSGKHFGERIIKKVSNFENHHNIMRILKSELNGSRAYDFLFIDFRQMIRDKSEFDDFAAVYSSRLSELMRKILVPKRYCAILIDFLGRSSTSFPIPWFFALACREHLRLRDEKVALVNFYDKTKDVDEAQDLANEAHSNEEDHRSVYYLLVFQATDDRRSPFRPSEEYLRLAKSPPSIPPWIIVKPTPRSKTELYHPAKFPEELIEPFIEFFTKPGETILDPMAGTGSTLIAAARTGRNALGMDINQEFVNVSNERLLSQMPTRLDKWIPQGDRDHPPHNNKLDIKMVQGDAMKIMENPTCKRMTFDYCITSPPYWSVLRNRGSEYQKSRRKRRLLQYYSNDPNDLGNIDNYERFLEALKEVYAQVATLLKPRGLLTVIVKNVKREHVIYPLAWDLTLRLCGKRGNYDYLGNTLWCQDDVKIRPFALGIVWVSNIFHHFCLHFKKRENI